MLSHLLKFVLRSQLNMEAEEIIVITDNIPLRKKRKAIEKAVKLALARLLPPSRRYRIMHHDSRSHYGLQIADYCCWAIFRRHERGETIHYDRIKSAVQSEFDIFRNGTTYYY